MRTFRIAGSVAAGMLVIGSIVVPGTAAGAVAMCGFDTVTIQGTEGADTINGTSGRDVISAGGGNDTVNGLGGNDTVCLGLGNDTFNGGAGNDIVLAEAVVDGADTFNGGPGEDMVNYGRRGLRVFVNVNGLADDGSGPELDNVKTDIEEVRGTEFSDTLIGGDEPNILQGLGGVDQIQGGGGNDDLFGNEGRDTISGGPGNDVVSGGLDDDVFQADPAVDGADFFFGDLGTDTASYQNRTASVFASLDGVSNDGALGEGDNIETDVENLVGGSGGDVLEVWGAGPNGVPANNTLQGGPGQDIIEVADLPFGNDVADGGGDVDVCMIDAQFDRKVNCEI